MKNKYLQLPVQCLCLYLFCCFLLPAPTTKGKLLKLWQHRLMYKATFLMQQLSTLHGDDLHTIIH